MSHSDVPEKLQEEFCLERYDAVWVPVWNNLLPSFSSAPKTEPLRSPKRYISTRLHGVTCHKTALFIVTTVIPLTSDFWEVVSMYDLFSTIHLSKAGSADITLVCTVVLKEGCWAPEKILKCSWSLSNCPPIIADHLISAR
jgi:hypothetical protein